MNGMTEYLERHSEPELNTGCVLWSGYRNKGGYGVVRFKKTEDLAHRAAWKVRHSCELGRWDFICHKCDTPACLNIDHLFLGTPRMNTDDQVMKGRQKRADPDKIKRGLELILAGASTAEAGRQTGITQAHFSRILTGKNLGWRAEYSALVESIKAKQ